MKKEMKKVPAVRFTGFTGDWEQRKLGSEASEIVAGGDVDKSKLVENGKYPVIANALTNDGIVGYYANDYRIKAPAVTVTGRGDVGHAQARKINFTPVVRLLSVTSKHDVDFLAEEINQNNVVLESTGVPQLTVPKLADYQISFPPTFDEEKAIGNYFTLLDSLITLHQRKSDQLKKLKAYFLQNLFPAKGEKVPKIRFKGFTDDWEQRKLGDGMYIKSRIGWQKLTKNEYLANGEYYLITGTDINENNHTVDLSKSYFVSKERYDKDKNIQVHDGDIIVTKDGTIGKVAMVCNLDKPATLNSHLFVLRDLSGKLDNRFLLQILSSPLFKRFIDETKTGSTLTGLPQKTFINFQFMMPLLKEQKKIASTLDRLDALITLHQRKLEALQTLKKFLLQNLFV